ncbi:hypothetical protein TSMEX_001848 [Taenia solium]|eukprot:TsM_001155000 transcript=TsM_001155000 gene=TsM_001155000
MLMNNDVQLNHLLDGNAIENPFVFDREVLLIKKADDGHKRIAHDLDEAHQHLLHHGTSEFYLCVLCFHELHKDT